MLESSWMRPIAESLITQTATWVVGSIIALLTVFSSKITESIKFALNRADLRSKYYEELAMDLSEFIFCAEIMVEFVENGWTTAISLVPRIKAYNDSITKLRKKEYVYLSWVERYWGKDKAAEFTKVADAVKDFDKAIHSLNDEFEEVNIKKAKQKVDSGKAKQAIGFMRPALDKLQPQSKSLLLDLQYRSGVITRITRYTADAYQQETKGPDPLNHARGRYQHGPIPPSASGDGAESASAQAAPHGSRDSAPP